MRASRLASGRNFARFLSTKMRHGVVSIEHAGPVAILRLNDPNNAVNTLNKPFQDDLVEAIGVAENDASVKAVVLISSKPGCFVAGADIGMLAECQTAEELTKLSLHGQQMLNRLANGKPTVAAINGACLGGGFELALACHYRIAADEGKTSIGLPEVQLGLLPGAGGTQRLPKLIGMQNALPLLLTGKNLKAKQAKKLKVVDAVADPFALEHAAVVAANGLINGSIKPDREPKGMVEKLTRDILEGKSFGRSYLFNEAKKGVLKVGKGNYPAPLRILEVARIGLEQGFEKGSEAEAKAFGELGMTRESKNLISIFFGNNSLKKNKFGKVESGKGVNTISVIGSGLMGAGIAQVSIEKNFNVVMKDMNTQQLARGEQQIWGNISKKRGLSSSEKEFTFGRLLGVTATNPNQGRALSRSDLIIEAVFEDLGVKQNLIKELESNGWLRDDAIFATNTSSLEVGAIASASKKPERVVGMHYFSPVDKMPLLEVIPHATTAKEVCAKAVDVGLRQGKTVIVTKDVPGFYVNRCLGPYMTEIMALLADGLAPQEVDAALVKFGMPVGPVSLCDEVGIDVGYHVQAYLSKFLGDRMKGGDGSALDTMVKAKMLGRKSGAGFYLYNEGSKSKDLNPDVEPILAKLRQGRAKQLLSDKEIAFRMVSRFANEAAFCLQDQIISSPVDGDIGAIFGVGFPPFLGGPFRWIDSYGVGKFVDDMSRLAASNGPQFNPAPLLVDMAKIDKKFHH